MLCWLPILLNENCGPESNITFRHEYAYKMQVDEIPCMLDDGSIIMCPIYNNIIFTPLPETGECVAEPEVPLGGVYLLNSTSIDEAGNEDRGNVCIP